MAKKVITPEEYKAKQAKKAVKRKKFFELFLKTLALCLAMALVYSATTIAYTRIEMLNPSEVTDANGDLKDGFEDTDYDNSGSTGNQGTTDSGNSGSTGNTPNNNGNNNNSNNNSNNSNSNNNTPATPNSGVSAADQEVLDMFKKGVAAARTNSSSVIRVKDGAINYKNHVKAGGLSDVATSLMGMFMAENRDAIEAKNEEWDKTKLPDPSALTLNGIQKITREDKGDTYVITVVAKNETNPKIGADGVGSVAGVIEESQITGAIGSVPGLQLSNINIAYENVTAVATIDKATGNCIALDLDAPCILGLDAKLLVASIDGAEVGIEVITEYKISY